MSNKSSRFKFLRCLVLCVGFIASPSSVMAQFAILQSNELNDISDINYDVESAEIEEISYSDRISPQSNELTFQFLTDSTETKKAILSNEDDLIAQANTKKKSKKKSKKSKKFKKGKKFKKYCNAFFEGTVIKGSEFTATGDFDSATLIQIFDDEAAYLSGSSAIQTIEYSTSSTEIISVGDQIGSVTVKTTQNNQLTFEYLSTTDTDYGDVVVSQTGGYGAITGVVDGDDESYIVVSNGRRGKKCKKFKKARKCKKGSNVFVQGDITAGGRFIETIDCSSDTLIQIFDDAPDYIFPDVSKTYWASFFIYRLSSLNIIQGFPDRDFLPESGITQAQFAAIISKAFNVRRIRSASVIENISRNYWAHGFLQNAYSMGFIDITTTSFNVNQRLTKLSVLTSIAKGLGYTQITSGRSIDDILSVFNDASSIPSGDRMYIAALVDRGILINYPNIRTLNINQVMSRAETCAVIHQALVSMGEFDGIASDYIVR